ncbi:hypothetical protein MPSEU_001103600 [Mayamaea pseudoterrestris]|nr:hypothetical protein MPSEU_001103600 [Mayamaea pseudoterrestris]
MAPPSVSSPVTTPYSSQYISSALKGNGGEKAKTVRIQESQADEAHQQQGTNNNSTKRATATTAFNSPTSTPAATLPTSNVAPLLPSSALYGGASSLYGGANMGMYGGGYGGGGAYNPMLMGGGMYSGGYGAMNMLGGPLNTLNQVLFSVQTVVFSLGQAVQIIGMNTQAIKQLFESLTGMFDHIVAAVQELQALEQQQRDNMTEQQLKRKRRLQMLRWTLATAVSYSAYRLVRRMFGRRRDDAMQRLTMGNGGSYGDPSGALPNFNTQYGNAGYGNGSYNGYGGMNHPPYSSSGMLPHQSSYGGYNGNYGQGGGYY